MAASVDSLPLPYLASRQCRGASESCVSVRIAQRNWGDRMTLDEFFAGYQDSRRVFDALHAAIGALGQSEIRVTKSQVAFQRRRTFAWAWVPDRYLRGGHAPLVLTMSSGKRDDSRRWKQVAEPAPGRFTHHLELWSSAEIDDEVISWLRQAWESAA